MRRKIACCTSPRVCVARQFRAFTLIEVLVSLGVIGLLIAIAIPAVQQVRESARKLQCMNNLRQLGIACAAYESTHNAYPLTFSGVIDRNGTRVRHEISCQARLLPFLDQTPIYAQINLSDEGIGAYNRSFPTSLVNQALMSVKVPVFLCPSDPGTLGVNYRANLGIGPSTYRFDSLTSGGSFRNFRSVGSHEIRDGLSNTIFFSEKLTGDFDDGRFTPERDLFFVNNATYLLADAEELCISPASAAVDHDSYRGSSWLYAGWRYTWYNHVRTPNSPDCDCAAYINLNGDGAHTARSLHRGGVNVVKGDGAVSFVADAIDLNVWRAMATREGGEVN